KTTLLVLWAASPAEERPFAWLSLDDAENDPVRFWTSVIAAVRTVDPAAGRAAEAALRSPDASLTDVVVPLLINELAARGAPLVLVLDDLHLIADARVHESLAFLLEHLPPAVHLAIATRTDPPLALGRLRARRARPPAARRPRLPARDLDPRAPGGAAVRRRDRRRGRRGPPRAARAREPAAGRPRRPSRLVPLPPPLPRGPAPRARGRAAG